MKIYPAGRRWGVGRVLLMCWMGLALMAVPGGGRALADQPGAPSGQETESAFTLAYSLTKAWGHSSGEVSAAGVAVDRWGNLYMAGQFSGTVNFDPAGDNPDATLSSYNGTVDAYLLKLDSHGVYQWVHTWGAGVKTPCSSLGKACGRDAANGVGVDPAGNVFVAGLFQNTVDFGGGHVVVSNAPNGSNNIFLAKFAADGASQWARAWGGTTGGEAYSLALDSTRGYVYVQGDWSTYPANGSVDFNPGGSGGVRYNHGKKDAYSSGFDAFLVKYDFGGNFQWVRTWGGTQYDDGPGVAVDEVSGSVYVCGMYGSTDINFDPTENPSSNGAQHPASDDSSMLLDIFLTKFDGDGNWQWVRTWGGQGAEDSGATAAVDRSGNVYALARFHCQGCNFNVGANGPAAPAVIQTASGGFDLALSKFDANGNYLWSKTWGGALIDQPTGLVIDEANDVYVAGMMDVTRSDLTYQILSSTAALTKILADGTLAWAQTWGGTGTDSPGSPALDGADNLYIPGQFQHSLDFDPGSGVDTQAARGALDAFLMRYQAETVVSGVDGGVVTVETGVKTVMAFPAALGGATVTRYLTSTPGPVGNQVAIGPAIVVNGRDGGGSALGGLPAPFTLTVHYRLVDAIRFKAGTLHLRYWDGLAGTWKTIDTQVDTSTRTLTAQVSLFGTFAVFGQENPKVFLPILQR